MTREKPSTLSIVRRRIASGSTRTAIGLTLVPILALAAAPGAPLQALTDNRTTGKRSHVHAGPTACPTPSTPLTRFPLAWGRASARQGAAPQTPAPTADQAARAAEAAKALAERRYAEAVALYSDLASALPANAGLQMNLGLALYMAGRPAQAVAPLQRAATLDPSLMPASLFLGTALLDLGRPADAIAPLTRAVAAEPNNPQARRVLGDALLAERRHADAAAQFERLTALDATSVAGWYGLGRSYEGEAVELFDALQEAESARGQVALLMADVMLAEGREDEAVAAAQEAATLAPDWRTAHEALAELLEARGQTAAAGTARARAAALTRDCAADPAPCAYVEGRLADVVAATRSATDPVSRFWRVKALNELAADAFERLDSLPPSRDRHLAQGRILIDREQYAEAARALEAALALAPGHPAVLEDLAAVRLQLRDADAVVTLLSPLKETQALSPRGAYLLGSALVDLQRLDEAVPILESTARQAPGQLPVRATLGRALVLAGRGAEAIPHLEAALPADTDGSTYYQLAQAYQRAGRPEEAKRALEEYQKRQK